MTTVYFIRHAESDYNERDGRVRPLTKKGMADREMVVLYLRGKNIGAILSSPYRRAVDTLSPFAEERGLEIELIEDFKEHRICRAWIEDWKSHAKKAWADFTLKIPDGESLSEVQARNVSALNIALARFKDKNIAIGTHGMALSTIIKYYDDSYGYDDLMAMADITPWVAKMEFKETEIISIEKIDLFDPSAWRRSVPFADEGKRVEG